MKDRIKQIRKDADLVQEEFGAELGVSRVVITTYETGRVIPDKSIRILICEKFNVNMKWLETGEGNMYRTGMSEPLVRAIKSMPAAQNVLERLLPIMTEQHWLCINDMLDRITNNK